ncbi:MAG: PepSY domain-containing protein [Gammaproteobacteria bacterium]|nr:PepSY domain-containing protein [Gammaproteobacteria bacterium]
MSKLPLSTLKARSSWLKIHRFLALSIGLLLALLGLTGSLSMLGEGLDHLLNPSLRIETKGQTPLSLDLLMAEIKKAHPDLKGSWTLELPRTKDDPVTAFFERPPESFGKLYAPLMVAVNPYTGEILTSRLWGETFRTWLLDLHSQLQAGLLGQRVVGGLGLILILSLTSGIILWRPDRLALRSAFAIRTNQGLNRFLLDLHRWLGLLGFPLLFVLAFTGFLLVFEGPLESILGITGMAHGEKGPAIKSSGQGSSHRPVSLDEAILLARGPFPKSEVRLLTTPEGPEGTYRITFKQRGEVNDRHPMTAVWVDQYSGQIREVRNALRFSIAETFLTAVWPVHTGEISGGWGHTLYFLSGLLLPLLYLSGLIRWLIGKEAIADRAMDLSPITLKLQGVKRHLLITLKQRLGGEKGAMDILKRSFLTLGQRFQAWLQKKGSRGW